ncbi:hypothetical protein ACLRGI_05095 [Paenarthrobacter nitroguajacolicus]|uniref:hypothetical protein n=1 Tax=Paenarthrobacter nitroguajacolicus TaxID=211146 RepID=UPI003AEAE309
MPKFSTHVALMNPEYQPANFAPGDEVPEWAIDQVGQHVLEPEAADAPDVPGFTGVPETLAADEGEQEDSGSDSADSDAADDGDSESSDEAADASDVPDFTAPAPARRGRARKQ